MSRWKRRVDRIKAEIPIARVLSDCGFDVHPDEDLREQQFSCFFHGDGSDSKPSARVYPESSSWYCFACSQTRDAIETIRAKEGLDFRDALRFLEDKYGLPQLPFEDDDHQKPAPKPTVASEVRQILDPSRTFADDLRSVRASLRMNTYERELPMDTLLSLWEASDAIAWLVENGQATEVKGRQALAKVQAKIEFAMFGEPA